jgi:hypothetical protein
MLGIIGCHKLILWCDVQNFILGEARVFTGANKSKSKFMRSSLRYHQPYYLCTLKITVSTG